MAYQLQHFGWQLHLMDIDNKQEPWLKAGSINYYRINIKLWVTFCHLLDSFRSISPPRSVAMLALLPYSLTIYTRK